MKKEMDCHQALRITHILFYSGLGLMLLSIAVGAMTNSTVVMVVLGLLGGVGAVAGLICGFANVKCPECGHSLMPGGRIPGGLPNVCPHCGTPL